MPTPPPLLLSLPTGHHPPSSLAFFSLSLSTTLLRQKGNSLSFHELPPFLDQRGLAPRKVTRMKATRQSLACHCSVWRGSLCYEGT